MTKITKTESSIRINFFWKMALAIFMALTKKNKKSVCSFCEE